MPSKSIELLKSTVNKNYGHLGISLYGSDPFEEHGTCFKIHDIPASFSVLTLDGTLPYGYYNIQIEGIPPGYYVYVAELSLDDLIVLIKQYFKPPEDWPGFKA